MTKSMVALSKNNGTLFATTEKVADILEREMDFVIYDWMEMVEKQEDLMHIPLNFEECAPISSRVSETKSRKT